MSGNQFAMVSEWMANGNIGQFITAHPHENRFELVRFPFKLLVPRWLITITRLRQLGDIAKGLVYMHGQGMTHGDLKGVSMSLRISPLSLKTFVYQGQYPYRPKWSRPSGGLRSAHDCVRRYKRHVLELVSAMWHVPLDEPRALRRPSDKVL